MANINPQLIPLNPAPQPEEEDEGCLEGVSDEIAKRFVQCSNSPAGTCTLALSLSCAAGGMAMTTTSLLPGIEASTRVALGVGGMCMQVTSLPLVGTMYGSWCTSSHIYKEANDTIKDLRENRDIVVNGLYGQVTALMENRDRLQQQNRAIRDHNFNLTRENEQLRQQRVVVYQPPANRVEFLEARAEAIRERLERMRGPIVQQPVRQAPVNPNPNVDDGYNSGVDE